MVTTNHSSFNAVMPPGQCRFLPEDQDPIHACNSYGIHFYTVGNSKYAYELTHRPAIEPSPTAIAEANPEYGEAEHCRQEGTLATKRSIPCCPTNLSRFLKGQPCYNQFDQYNRTDDIICQPGDAGQCGIEPHAWNEQSWTYHPRVQGDHSVILPGYTFRNRTDSFSNKDLQCIEEVEFGTGADGNATCVPVTESSCNDTAGNRPDSSNSGKGKPSGGVSSMRRREKGYLGRGGYAKNVALLVFTPLLLQMLFL